MEIKGYRYIILSLRIILYTLDSSNIKAEGCKYLAQGKWAQLQTLDLNLYLRI